MEDKVKIQDSCYARCTSFFVTLLTALLIKTHNVRQTDLNSLILLFLSLV